MSIDKQRILHDLNLKDSVYSSCRSTPLMFSRDSSMDTLSSFNINFHSHNSTYNSEHSTNPSGILSPSEIPDSPPRGCDDDIDDVQLRSFVQPLNNTNSTGRTLVPQPKPFLNDDDRDEVDSIRNYASSPLMTSYHNDADIDEDDNGSIRSSISSLSLPSAPATAAPSTTNILSNIHELRNKKLNLSVINEESLMEQNDRRNSSINISHTTTDDDDDDDQKGKQLLFSLIRQRLPHHHLSLAANAAAICNEKKSNNSSASSSSSTSSCVHDQTMRADSSAQDLSSHDITLPSSTMQESGYDSLLPVGSACKRSLSSASLSTTRSITIKKKHRCNEENDDPMTNQSNNEMTDEDDEHYDKKAGEALLRNLIAQVLPSFNPRYLNGDPDEEDEIISHPRRPSPISRVNSSSNASSIRSDDLDIEMTKKSEKNISIRSGNSHIVDVMHQEKIHRKRSYVHKPVHQTKASELRRLQSHSRR